MNIPCELYDAMFMSPHKLLGGPASCGLLIIKKSLVDTTIPPSFAGGGTVEYVNKTSQNYQKDIVKLNQIIISFLEIQVNYV